MDITKHNLEEEFDNIKKVIEESTFLAIDGEFTGLSRESVARICAFDTPGDRYRKLREGASDFLLIQFGLCAFKADKVEKKYEARPYNFYIFPHPHSQQAPDRRFLCQASCIDFLISHNFDFNKVFKEGIPYLTNDQETKLRANLQRRQAERMNSSMRSPEATSKTPFKVPAEHKEFISNIRAKVDAYLQSDQSEPLALPPCNAFQRRLIYQSLGKDYPLVKLETKTGEKKERFLSVTKCLNQEDAEELERKAQAMERMKLDIQVGFTKIMKLITESGKLVVGHNMYLDVIHSVNHFYGPIPQELEDFKGMTNTVFPRLLDTKLMASTNPFKDYFMGTSLEELKVTTTLPPFKTAKVELPEGFTKYTDGGGTFHEAGYDAFVTGSCFASMSNFLGRYQNPASNFLLPSSHGIQPFVNKLFMMRIQDIPYVNLVGADVEPNRDHVFHITFPEEWRTDDLHQLFEPYGNIQISWLTKTTAYAGLHKRDNAKLATTGLVRGQSQSGGPAQIISYSLHRQMMQARSQDQPATSHRPANPNASAGTAPPATDQTVKLDPAGSKRRLTATDIAFPATKISRQSLNTEAVPCPSTKKMDESEEKDDDSSEEDLGVPVGNGGEEMEDGTEETDGDESSNQSSDGEEEEDLGVAANSNQTETIVKGKDTKMVDGVSSDGDKLFAEPAW